MLGSPRGDDGERQGQVVAKRNQLADRARFSCDALRPEPAGKQFTGVGIGQYVECQ
jgi:hypothetical protein